MSSYDTGNEPKEGLGMGAAVGITLYGLAVVIASLFLDKDLVPKDLPLVAVALLVAAVIGAVLGAARDRLRS